MLSEAASLMIRCSIAISRRRSSRTMDVADMVGAMFVTGSDRLSKYWRDASAFERFTASEPLIGTLALDLREHGWDDAFRSWVQRGEGIRELSQRARAVYSRAKQLAEAESPAPGAATSLVFPEHFLLAIVEKADLGITQRLLASGLRSEDLERDVEHGIR